MNYKNSTVSKMKKVVELVEASIPDVNPEVDTDIEDGETEDTMADLITDALYDVVSERIADIKSYADVGMLTNNVGLVIKMTSGKTFQVQIVEA